MTSSSAVTAKELKRRDFILNGNLWKVVASLALPLFFFAIFNYIYSIIDTIMCSGLSKAAVNAVSPLNQVTNLISAIGNGLSAGGSILIAREIGRKDYEKAKKLSTTVFTFAFAFALLTDFLVIPLHIPLLRAFRITEESIAIGRVYFIFSVLTQSLIMVDTVYLGVEKASGNTLTITLLNLGVVVIKVLLNVLFLYAFHLKDMMYVSLATLLANACLFVYVIFRLASRKYLFHYSFKYLGFDRHNLRKITFISFPIFLGKFIFSLGKVVINALAKDYGNDVVGALGVSNNMGGSVTNPLSSIEDSSSAIISQNLGAGNVKRAIDTFYVSLVYELAIAITGVILVTVFDTPITRFFARSAGTEEEITEFANHISQVFFFEKMGIITLALNSCVLGLLYGFGYTRLSMALNIARVFVFRIPSFLICKYCFADQLDGYQTAGISMGVSNICIGIVALLIAIVVLIRIAKKNRMKEGEKKLTKEEGQALEKGFKDYLKNFTHYKKTGAFCYEDGIVLRGAYCLYQATHEKEYLNFCLNYYETNIGENGEVNITDDRSIDDIQAGTTLYDIALLHHEDKFDKALVNLRDRLFAIPRTNGSFWHKARYPEQIWLDGLYMGMPFYARIAGSKYVEDPKKAREDILLQFNNVEKYNRNPEDGCYYHCYDDTKSMPWADKVTGRSPNVWLRSVGWLAMASLDCASVFEDEGHGKEKKEMIVHLKNVLNSMEKSEDENHLWKDLPLIEDPKNYEETSGSLMFAYTKMKGARKGYLPYTEMKEGIDIFESVVKRYFHDGKLGNICLVSGLDAERRDGSVAYYLSEPVVENDAKGMAPLMMAYSEYITSSY